MKNRNLIADAFFECVSAFSERTGAESFDSFAERGGRDGKGALQKMVCTAGYEKFDIEYTYSVRSLLASSIVSIFDVRVIFNRRKPEIKYSLYDIMYLMDPDNFKCYHFSYIETPERMRDIFRSIEPDLETFIPRLGVIASQRSALKDIDDKFRDGVNSFFGRDVFSDGEENQSAHDLYLSALEHYYSLSDSFYESKAYALFLSGDYKKAHAAMSRYHKKTYYQVRLSSFVSDRTEEYRAAEDGCNTVGEAMALGRYQNLRVLLGTLILFVPCLLVHIGLHFVYAKLLFWGALWSTAYTFIAALSSAPFVLPFAAVLSLIFDRFTIKLLSKKKRTYLKNLEKIAPPFSKSGCAKFFVFIMLSVLIITTLLNVNSFTAFYDDGFRYKESVFDIAGTYYPYSDVKALVKVQGRYDGYGNYEKFDSYVIITKDGKPIDFLYEVSNEQIEKHLVPILLEKGVTVTEIHDIDLNGLRLPDGT